jgi:hypothetical protein
MEFPRRPDINAGLPLHSRLALDPTRGVAPWHCVLRNGCGVYHPPSACVLLPVEVLVIKLIVRFTREKRKPIHVRWQGSIPEGVDISGARH